jgi:SpoVK/Ycf46/Vps4 family AAA+-type ATPase
MTQGNEAEALRSWREALDQIYFHNAYRVPSGYRPGSETEKALMDSLRDMEMQCKERVDLLEALKRSREEQVAADAASGTTIASSSSSTKISKSTAGQPRRFGESDTVEKGWIGEGTIPAADYLEIAKPPLPHRSKPPRKVSNEAVVGRNLSGSSNQASQSATEFGNPLVTPLPTLKPTRTSSTTKPSRSPSPKERSMLTTLRSGKSDKKMSKSSRNFGSSKQPEDGAISMAATLAWNARSKPSKDSLSRTNGGEAASLHSPTERPGSSGDDTYYDNHTRRMVSNQLKPDDPKDIKGDRIAMPGPGFGYPFPRTDPVPANASSIPELRFPTVFASDSNLNKYGGSLPSLSGQSTSSGGPNQPPKLEPAPYPTYLREYPITAAKQRQVLESRSVLPVRRRSPARAESYGTERVSVNRKPVANTSSPRKEEMQGERRPVRSKKKATDAEMSSTSLDEEAKWSPKPKKKAAKVKQNEDPVLADGTVPKTEESESTDEEEQDAWTRKVKYMMKHLPKGVDELAAKQILNEIVVKGDEVHWADVAGLQIAKNALKEAVVYPFLRPDLFMGLREPARGMLLFGPPGTGKTMLARAVATESRSTFFSISASSLTSKYLGESEKLVRALFALAKALAPSIIFVDEIDSLLSSRSGSGEHEATRRIKTEFLIQWSDLQRAAAGREQTEKEKMKGDASRVLVLAATNIPWAIDEAARRRFVRRQYIPLPEGETRAVQLRNLLGHQKHNLDEVDIQRLVILTDGESLINSLLQMNNLLTSKGFSGSDITALAKDAAMGPLRSLGEKLLQMSMDEIRPIQFQDFEASLINIRPSVSYQGLKHYDDWAKEFGERGG